MINSLDEAIKHCEEVAEELRKQASIGLDSMDDTIRVERCRECANEHRQLAEWLKELKQLREQTRWIPVSERLPDDSTVVFYTDNKGETGMICYWEDLPWEFEDIIAWKPLPEPYKEDEADVE